MVSDGAILVVDDNKSVLNSLNLFLKHKVRRVVTCCNPNLISSILGQEEFDVVLLDMNFNAGVSTGNEGIFWMREIHRIDPQMVVILITAYGDVQLAVNAMKEGATDFILKPWDNQKLLATLMSAIALSRSRKEVATLKQQQDLLQQDSAKGFDGIIGESPAMQEVQRTIAKVAKTDANVLILGENGTGKELVARQIHRLSGRSGSMFLGVDLGSLSESLFESELFGHVKGAFTDAKSHRVGRFQVAHGGTLFLDEIGNLSLPMQAKLLSAIQNREITPIGSNKPVPVDVRLVCATNTNLPEAVKAGAFREDLLYRINTIQIKVPPLRERGTDIVLLANHFLKRHGAKYGKPGIKLAGSSLDLLMQYHWPGNVRELSHAMERAVILSEGAVLTPHDFFLQPDSPSLELGASPVSLDEAEKILIANAIRRNKGNLSGVARELNIGRQTLYRKMEKYGL
jgi:DNA-binding NtrC family response regulator